MCVYLKSSFGPLALMNFIIMAWSFFWLISSLCDSFGTPSSMSESVRVAKVTKDPRARSGAGVVVVVFSAFGTLGSWAGKNTRGLC